MVAQLNIIIAHLYKDGLDKFGGMNIYTREEAREKVVKGRATDVETFEFVESLLKENISKLPKKTSVNEAETSMLKQGFALHSFTSTQFPTLRALRARCGLSVLRFVRTSSMVFTVLTSSVRSGTQCSSTTTTLAVRSSAVFLQTLLTLIHVVLSGRSGCTTTLRTTWVVLRG